MVVSGPRPSSCRDKGGDTFNVPEDKCEHVLIRNRGLIDTPEFDELISLVYSYAFEKLIIAGIHDRSLLVMHAHYTLVTVIQ